MKLKGAGRSFLLIGPTKPTPLLQSQKSVMVMMNKRFLIFYRPKELEIKQIK
jgi:P pilus assembly chaperone PapD